MKGIKLSDILLSEILDIEGKSFQETVVLDSTN